MSNRDLDSSYSHLDQVLGFCFRQEMKDVHTSIPGVVESYNAETKRASIQIAMNMLIKRDNLAGNPESVARPIIQDVPVLHVAGGGYVIHVPLVRGNAVMLLFSERGIERFKERFEVSDPTVGSFFAERDAVAIPGFGSLEHKLAGDGLTIQTEDGQQSVQIHADGTIVAKATNSIVLDAPTITLKGASDTLVVP